MSGRNQIDADIEAIAGLREALSRFTREQVEATRAVEHEILATIAELERAEGRRRYEVAQCQAALRECEWRAQQAAAEGYGWDCSRERWALDEAVARLERVLAWRARVEDEAYVYRAAADGFVRYLEYGLPRGTAYLDERVAALEEYRAASLRKTSARAAGSAAGLRLDPARMETVSVDDLAGEDVRSREARGELRAETLEVPSERGWVAQVMEGEERAARNPYVAGDPVTGAVDPRTLGEAVQNLAEIAVDALTARRERREEES